MNVVACSFSSIGVAQGCIWLGVSTRPKNMRVNWDHTVCWMERQMKLTTCVIIIFLLRCLSDLLLFHLSMVPWSYWFRTFLVVCFIFPLLLTLVLQPKPPSLAVKQPIREWHSNGVEFHVPYDLMGYPIFGQTHIIRYPISLGWNHIWLSNAMISW
jgi:hypothetical protein